MHSIRKRSAFGILCVIAGDGWKKSVRRTVTRERFGLLEWLLGDQEMSVLGIFARRWALMVFGSAAANARASINSRWKPMLLYRPVLRLLLLRMRNTGSAHRDAVSNGSLVGTISENRFTIPAREDVVTLCIRI